MYKPNSETFNIAEDADERVGEDLQGTIDRGSKLN
jgi:hypothetical protein